MIAVRVRCVLCCVLFAIHAANCVEISWMSRPVQCPGQVVSAAHRYRTQAAHSVVECAAHCLPDRSCVSIVYDVDRGLCHFGNATAQSDCSNMEAAVGKIKYYEIGLANSMEPYQDHSQTGKELRCENGGILSANGTYCTCPAGCSGNNCGILIQGCEDLLQDGTHPNDNYLIKPTLAPAPFFVHCLVAANLIRTRVLRRSDAGEDFNRTFREYRDGFGQLGSKTDWLGLEKIHQITASRAYELRIQFRPGSTILRKVYYDFVVNDEASGYSFSTSGCSQNPDLRDCLSDLAGAPFSAYDLDNDGSDSVNCALRRGCGWWFKGDNCSSCNPFGPILDPDYNLRRGVLGEAFWEGLGDWAAFPSSFFLVAAL